MSEKSIGVSDVQALANRLGIPYIKLNEERIDSQVVRLLPEEAARKFNAVPVRLEGNDLYVAFSSPLNLPARDEIRLITGCTIKPMISTEKEIRQAIDKYYRVEETSKQAIIDMRMERLKKEEGEKREKTLSIEEEIGNLEDIPVIKLLNNIIDGAISAKASDIHLEPQEPEMRVRYRIDGILRDIMNIPKHIESSVISRIKVMSNLDITEKRRPQDGHISIKREDKDYDFRVSTLLTVNGEKVVMRILDRSSMLINLTNLGLTEYDEQVLRSLIAHPNGMILVTGPTGSGKTTTLYAILSQLSSDTQNIITIENPVEYKLVGINQIQVDPSINMTFATGLRTILRQDPDVIMVGEIRDRDTAEIAIQAALTGHLVFSTLHTNDASSAITRLIDMGIEPFLISSTVIGAIAQRLCRAICTECKVGYEIDNRERQWIISHSPKEDVSGLSRGKGCDYCYHTGYRGRTGIFEVMRVSEGIMQLILNRRPSKEIRDLARKEGMRTLRQNGLQKVLEGATTIDEVKRVVYFEEEE